jgi:predicted GIY-YIG superfamily endonuclease
MNYTVSIYAFKRDGRFLYVGQSHNPLGRIKGHRHGRLGSRIAGTKMVILRTCKSDEASRIEGQIIAALRRRGECELNARGEKSRKPYAGHESKNCKRVVSDQGISWPSQAAAGRYFGRSVAWVYNAIHYGDSILTADDGTIHRIKVID